MNEDMVIDMNDMYIEDVNVFDQLEDTLRMNDLDESGISTVDKEIREIVGDNYDLYLEEENEISDITHDEDVNFEDLDSEDVIKPEEEDESDDSDYDEYDDDSIVVTNEDGEVIDYQDYNISLPDGSEVNLEQVMKGYIPAEQFQHEKQQLAFERQQFEHDSKDMRYRLSLCELESSKVIKDYEDYDFNQLSKDDPDSYVEHREYLDKYKSREKEVYKEYNTIKELEQEQERNKIATEAAQCNHVLKHRIAGWNADTYKNLMGYGHYQLGMDKDFIQNCTDPSIFMVLHKAMELDEGKKIVKAKIKSLSGKPMKRSTVRAMPTAKASASTAKKAAMNKKLSQGTFDSNDLSSMFNMLED